MRKAAPALDVRVWPEVGDMKDILYAACWLPPANVVKSFPNLRVIFSLGAGVDAILSDPTLPTHVPIVRVNDDDLTHRMSEFIVMHVLMHHRQQLRVSENQRRGVWDAFSQHAAKDMTVGIMGLGVLGQDAAKKLRVMGFEVRGWSRSSKTVEGVQSYAGPPQLDAFLSGTDILVSLLPATPETDGIINRALISKLSRKGPFAAPILINAGRGRQQSEDEILACLDDGSLYAASLDVFRSEPLPAASRFWSHPKVMVSPHTAADSDPATICAYIVRQITASESGITLQNQINIRQGY
ncbi:MAG: glyoxylate/hydroxypyruvate reductase A [Aestuariivirga sp.]